MADRAKKTDPWLSKRIEAMLHADQAETTIQDAVHAMLATWLPAAKARVLPPSVTAAGVPNPDNLHSADDELANAYRAALQPKIEEVFGQAFARAARDATISAQKYREMYVAKTTARITAISETTRDEIAALVRMAIDADMDQRALVAAIDAALTLDGAPPRATLFSAESTYVSQNASAAVGQLLNVPLDARDAAWKEKYREALSLRQKARNAKTAAEKAVADGGDPWAARATMIARTEAMSALNGGTLNAMQARADVFGDTLEKQWLATEDDRTRDTHRQADGQRVGLDLPFAVGGAQMMHPGDPEGPPEETVNCRCTMLEVQADETLNPATGRTITAAGTDGTPTGVAILAMLTSPDAAKLAVADGEPADEMHVTIGYLANPAADYTDEEKADILARLTAAIDPWEPVAADAFATAHFNPEDDEREPCAVVLVQSDDLATLHDAVAEALGDDASTTFPIWIPHVTVAYNADPTVIPEGVVGGTVTFDRVVVGWGGEQIDLTSPAASTSGVTAGANLSAESVTFDGGTVTAPAAVAPTEATAPGQPFTAVIAVEGEPSGDGRMFAEGALTWRDLPMSLTAYQHNGYDTYGIPVGRVETIERDGNLIRATGFMLDFVDDDAAKVATKVAEKAMRGISVECDESVIEFPIYEDPIPGDIAIGDEVFAEDPLMDVTVFKSARIMAVTVLTTPALPQCVIQLGTEPVAPLLGTDPSSGPAPATDTTPPAPVAADGFAAGDQAPADDADSVTKSDGTAFKVGDDVLAIVSIDGVDTPVDGTVSAVDTANSTVDIDVDGGDPAKAISVEKVWADPDEDDSSSDDSLAAAGGAKNASMPMMLEATTATLLAAGGKVNPPKRFFDDPKFGADPSSDPRLVEVLEVNPKTKKLEWTGHYGCPPTINDDGSFFGHLAIWDTCHVGIGEACVSPPNSLTDYAFFHVGDLLTAEGEHVSIGRITLGGGHADPKFGYRPAMAHYDNAGAAAVDVRAGEDEHGIWVAGAMRTTLSAEDLRAFRAAPLSGDWRRIGGGLELMGALCVNLPGFPVPRPTTFVHDGVQQSLAASGAIRHFRKPTAAELDVPAQIRQAMALKRRADVLRASIGRTPESRLASLRLDVRRPNRELVAALRAEVHA